MLLNNVPGAYGFTILLQIIYAPGSMLLKKKKKPASEAAVPVA